MWNHSDRKNIPTATYQNQRILYVPTVHSVLLSFLVDVICPSCYREYMNNSFVPHFHISCIQSVKIWIYWKQILSQKESGLGCWLIFFFMEWQDWSFDPLEFLSLIHCCAFTGDCNDKGTAGADGTHGERVQPRHPSHHLLSSAGLCSGHSAWSAAPRYQEEEKCHPEVRIALQSDLDRTQI